MDEILMKVYYTPVNNPESINLIEVNQETDYRAINRRIKEYCQRKRKPLMYHYNDTEIAENPTLSELKEFPEKFPNIDISKVKTIFETLSNFLYTSAKLETRYFGLIVTREYAFLYHYIPKAAVTFEEDNIKEFIKYFDESTINWFLLHARGNIIKSITNSESEDLDFEDDDEIIYAHAKQGTSGLSLILDREIEYEQKGEVFFRAKYKPKTDIIIDTTVDVIDDELPRDGPIVIDLDRGILRIEGLQLSLEEVSVGTNRYTSQYFEIAKYHIMYKKLHVEEILKRIEFYLKKLDPEKIIEKPNEIKLLLNHERDFKTVRIYYRDVKPSKSTYYIYSGRKQISDSQELILALSSELSSHCSVGIVEVSSFNDKYVLLDLGTLTIFARIKNKDTARKIANNINELVNSLSRNNTPSNALYKRLLTLIGLIELSKTLVSTKLREILLISTKQAIAQILQGEYGLGPSMAIKELDKLGVDLKAGVRKDNRGIFDSSPSEFSKKLLKKMKRREKTVIYLIGINEDTKDFSPVPLNKVRDEFITSAKEKIEENSDWHVIEMTPIPLNEKEGVLLIIAMKNEGLKNVAQD